MAATLLDSIQNKYGAEEDNQEDYGWIVFVSNSPECKKGMFPPIMTLSDYDISTIGKKLRIIKKISSTQFKKKNLLQFFQPLKFFFKILFHRSQWYN